MNNVATSDVAQTLKELSELVSNLLLLLSDKEKTVIKKRFNLAGGGKSTLEEIGQEFSVTRERVRQIEKNALAKMRRNVFNTQLRHIHDFAGGVVRNHGGLVKEDTLLSELKAVLADAGKLSEDCIHLALVLHEGLECVGNTINFYPYAREKDMSDYNLKFASNHLINQLHKYGQVKSLGKIHNDLSDVLREVDFDVVKVRSLIDIDKRVLLLDDEMVGLLEWRHVYPRTLRDKILYVLRSSKKPMHFRDISIAIESAGFDSRGINVQAVHNELIRHGQFVLIGRGIYALDEWGYEAGTVANVIERILTSKKELSVDEIVSEVLGVRQVKRITIVLALKNGKKFERVGRKHYKLKK